MIKINGVSYSRYLILPIKYQKTFDESLDLVVCTLSGTTLNTPFEPATRVQLDDEYYLIAYDKLTQTRYGANKKYRHDLTLIEETKIAEKYILDSCTFTKLLWHNYLESKTRISYEKIIISGDDGYIIRLDNGIIMSPIETGIDITFPTLDIMISPLLPGQILYSVLLYKNNVLIDSITQIVSGAIPPLTLTQNNISSGFYRIEYKIETAGYELGSSYSFYVISPTNPPSDYSITDVINRCCAILETQRIGETPKFSFNAEQSAYYSNILAPEFSFTKNTFREMLFNVAKSQQAIPKINNYEISFLDLSTTNYATLPRKYISYTSTYDIEQFCSSIDSTVENLVNNDSLFQGTINEPFNDGFKTPRVETGQVEITDSTGFIETLFPIEALKELEIGFLPDETLVGDISNYVYTSTEYSTLSSYTNEFPGAKSFALYYKQGEKNVYGLNFTNESATPDIFKIPAILNIINTILGTSYNNFSAIPSAKMQYRIKYVPVVTSRIKQIKTKLNDTTNKSTLIYNQTSNKIDNDYYGENLKGTVARLGNIEKVITYKIKNWEDIPEVGLKINEEEDYFITVVKIEKLKNYYKVELGLSKNFNRLNEYIGIDTNIRQSEISSTQVQERFAIREDCLVIGDEYGEKTSIVTEEFLNIFKQSFTPPELEVNYIANNNVSCMVCKTKDTESLEITQVVLPTISSTYGNSILYQINFNNNFGAGNIVNEFSTEFKGIQNEVQYGDIYGKVEYLAIKGFCVPIVSIPDNYADNVILGAKLPYILDEDLADNPLFDTGTADIILKKDNREAIRFGYQIHCATTESNVVVGSGLAKKLLIRKTDFENAQRVDFVVLNRQVAELEQIISEDDIQEILNVELTVDAINKNITFNNPISTTIGKSIVAIDKTLNNNEEPFNELIFAVNININIGDTINIPTLRFRHLLDK